MSIEANIEVQQKFGEAINSGNLKAFKNLVSATAVDHDPAPDQGEGPKGYVKLFTALRSAFPDLRVEVVHMVADEDNVAFAYEVTGTHKGEFMGIAPTNIVIKARGLQISKFENGKMTERWGSSDELGILKQLGAKMKAKKNKIKDKSKKSKSKDKSLKTKEKGEKAIV